MNLERKRLRGLLLLALTLLALTASSSALFAQDTPTVEYAALEPSEQVSLDAPKTGGAPAPRDGAAAAAAEFDPLSPEPVSIIVVFDKPLNPRLLEMRTGGQVVYEYSTVFDGVSMILPSNKVDDVAALDGIGEIYLDHLLQLDTEASPAFIGAPAAWNQLGGQANAGEGVVVGILDSGIWPEHASVSDPDPLGKPYAAPSVAPGSNGFGSGGPRSTCNFGNTSYNPNDVAFTCNNKLIGAYSFIDTYKALLGLLPTEFDSARDDNGHGTHTLTTSAGNRGVAAAIFGIPRGTVSGIAPRAHVIAYRVCANQGCFQSDSIRAVEQAILDGVDVINFSISGGNNPYADAVELAFAAAYDNGVFVAASAGNSGPTPDTVSHRGPWVTTVAASTSNRHFLSTLTLTAGGDTLQLVGATVTGGITTPTPVILAPSIGCLTPFAPGTFSGQIVICERGVIARVEKSYNVAAGGAGGMILYNPIPQGLNTDNHFIPSIHIDQPDSATLLAFMNSHTGVTGTFTQGTATAVPGDVMAPFSSRGGPGQNLGVNKPDITAPGVQILAGHTPFPATSGGGLPGQLFQAIQGTSMSSPHIAGSAALLADLRPNWTPGQIKSAMMLSARTNVVKEDGSTPANPFDTGSGRVDLTRAGNVGLTMDESAADYFALQTELWNANYPSLYIPNLSGSLTVQRTVHNESGQPRNWKLSVKADPGLIVDVPNSVHVPGNGDATFDITVSAPAVAVGQVRHAVMTLKQGNESLTFPISIVRGQANVNMVKNCAPTSIAIHQTTNCSITLTNTATTTATVSLTDTMPQPLTLVNGSVVGATQSGNSLSFNGTLFGAAAPTITVTPGASPLGYVPIGVAPINCTGNCDDTGFNFGVGGLGGVRYNGATYATVGLATNGFVQLGGLTSFTANNQNLPNATAPNNVLAPLWTDLHPLGTVGGGTGRLRAATATLAPGLQYLIFDWRDVGEFGNLGTQYSFQVWMRLGGVVEEIYYTYGRLDSTGAGGLATVGAEDAAGVIGQSRYFNGTGTFPTVGGDLKVASAPGAPGETKVITFTARGKNVGEWTNCAHLTSSTFSGTANSCVSGQVGPPSP